MVDAGDQATQPAGTISPACTDPVFVLCTSRSGSTLLRFLLDAHPDLACPPETKMPNVLAQLARLWMSTEALGRAESGGASISDAAAAGIRHSMDLMIGPYLARRGKKRYCDKNLGTEPHVETLLAVYPEAQFICLYRHPMDMIASGVEACPWGLNQYGFEPYVANAPGNSVLALGRYWADHVAAILAVEDKYPGKCHRVRYEDLVADPEAIAEGIFGFLGLPSVPGISARAFSHERERMGPGDFKIWNTSQITDDSVGRGWSVPADLIPAPLTETINRLVDRLGYVRVDANWGTIRKPVDLRLPADGQTPAPKSAIAGSGQVPRGSLLVNERLQAGLGRLNDEFIQEWRPYADGSFLMVALAASGSADDVWWLVDPGARKVVSGHGNCTEDRGWTISAPDATWEQVIRDGLNLGIAFRRHGMRYRDQGGGGAGSITADNRVSMMSDLLGVVTWGASRADLRVAHPSAQADLVSAPPPDAERQRDAPHENDVPPWEHDRQPLPKEADLDAALWQRAPADQAPEVARIARVSFGTNSKTVLITPRGKVAVQSPRTELPPAEESAPADERRRTQPRSRTTTSNSNRRPRSARERLRAQRALKVRRRRRFRLVMVGAIGLIVAAVISGVALHGGGGPSIAVNAATPGFGYLGPYAPVTLNADNSITMAQPGVTEPVLAVYEDFQCSACRTFEKSAGAVIQQLAAEGKVKVVYYPFTVFASQPQRDDSIRAWAAAKCVPARSWVRYHNSLYASQPPATSADGFALSLLVQLGRSAGIASPSFEQCVQSQRYALQDAPLSNQIINSGVSGMLTLKLNGQVLDPALTPSQLRRQIMSASSGRTAA